MPAAVLTIDINARLASLEAAVARIPGSFRGATRGVETELDRIGKKMTAFGTGALAAIGVPLGAGAVLSFLQSVVTKAAEGERSVNQLNAVLKTTGSGITKGQLGDISDKIQSKTVFDDDAINAAAASLLRFRKIQGDTFREALELAPDVAARLGIDLPAAAQLLGRSLTEPESEIKAFKVAGVALSEQLKDTTARMIENGNIAGAQAIRLDELKRAFGGASEADNQGVYGATKRFGRAWDDMLKLLGKGVAGNGSWISTLADQMDKITKNAQQFSPSLEHIYQIAKRRGFNTIAADVLNGRDIRGPGITASGKIRGIKSPEEEKAEADAERERQRQADEQRYLEGKAALTKLAAVTSIVNQEKLVKLKATLDTEGALYDQAYKHNEIAVKEFYSTQRTAADATHSATMKSLTEEGEALEKQYASAITREEKSAIELRVRGIGVQQAQAQAEHQKQIVGISIQEADAVRRLKDEYEGLGIRLAELQGDDVAAANRGFALANQELLARIHSELQSADPSARERAAAALAEYTALKQLVDVRSRLADSVKQYGLTVDELAIAQERINIAESSGALTTLGALERRSALNEQYVEILNRELAVLEKIARESGRREDLIKVEQMRAQIEALAAQTDLLADKFNNIGKGSFSSFLQDLAGGKGFKASIQNLGQSLQSQLNTVFADFLSEKAFGKDGPLSGFGKLFSKAFKGAGDLGGTATVQTQLVGLGTTSTTTSSALAQVTTAAYQAAAALQSMGGGGGGLGSLFGSGSGGGSGFGGPDPSFSFPDNPYVGPGFGTYAVGTPFVARDMLARLHKGERVVTAADNSSGRWGGGGAPSRSTTVVVNQTVMPGASTQTARQAAKAAGDAARNAVYRG